MEIPILEALNSLHKAYEAACNWHHISTQNDTIIKQTQLIISQNERMITLMSANQDTLDQLTATTGEIATHLAKVDTEVQALEAASQAGETLDFGPLKAGLSAIGDAVQKVDTDATAPVPAPPADTTTPTDGSEPSA